MKRDDEDEGLIPLGAMAARLGIQPRELRREADAGQIPYVRVGDRALLFDPKTVERVLAERAGATAQVAIDRAREDHDGN